MIRYFVLAFLALGLCDLSLSAPTTCAEIDAKIAEGKQYADRKAQSEQETKLLLSTAYWRNGRTSQKEFRRARMALYLKNALEVDRPYVIIEELTPLFKSVYENHHSIQKNKQLIEDLQSQISRAENLPAEKLAQIKVAIEKAKSEIETARGKISYYLEEYAAASSYLEAVAKSDGPGKENAKTVLDKLHSRFLIKDLAEGARVTNPKLGELYKEVNETRDSRIAGLKRERRAEFLNWAMSVAPSQLIFDQLERIAKTVPFLDQPTIHSILGTLSTQRDRKIYSSDIARVVGMRGDVNKQLELLEQINSETEDAFLRTFSRGVESRKTWTALKKAAEAREDKALFERMKKAEASAGTDMSLVRNSGRDRLIHLALNGGLASLLGWALTPSGDDDEKATTELDKLLEFLEKDPAGKALVEKYRSSPQ